MSDYDDVYEKQFVRNLRRYASLEKRIRRRVERILANPYLNTEPLDIDIKVRPKGAKFLTLSPCFHKPDFPGSFPALS